jgi:hypothetical protein
LWEDTRIVLPAQLSSRVFRSLFTGAHLQPADDALPAWTMFRVSPVAVLIAEPE